MNKYLLSKKYILTVISAAFFYTASFMLNTVLGRFITDSGNTQSMAGIVAAAFTLSSFFTRSYWGWITDKKGRKMVYLIGSALSLAGNGLLIFNTDIPMIIISRLLFGAGYSALTTAGGTIVCDVLPPDSLGQGIAVYGVTNVLSQAVAPVLALWLYKTDFIWVVSSVGVLCVLTLIVALFIKYSESRFTDKTRKFQLYEKTAMPAAYTIIFFAMATASVNSFIPILAKQRMLTADSWFFFISALFLLVSRLMNRKIIENEGEVKTFYGGSILYLIGFIILSLCDSNLWLIGAGAVYGFGAGIIHPIVNTAAVKRCADSDRGTATGTFMMSQDLGMTIGAFLWGIISEKAGFGAVYIAVAALILTMIYVYRKFLRPCIKGN